MRFAGRKVGVRVQIWNVAHHRCVDLAGFVQLELFGRANQRESLLRVDRPLSDASVALLPVTAAMPLSVLLPPHTEPVSRDGLAWGTRRRGCGVGQARVASALTPSCSSRAPRLRGTKLRINLFVGVSTAVTRVKSLLLPRSTRFSCDFVWGPHSDQSISWSLPHHRQYLSSSSPSRPSRPSCRYASARACATRARVPPCSQVATLLRSSS